MSNGARVAAAVASGYLLGRGKKLKLAVVVGGLLAGKRIATTPSGLLRQANDYVESNPELSKLSETARTSLMESARRAAVHTASGRIDRLSDAIHDRTQQLNDGFTEPEADDDQPDADAEPAEEKPAQKTPKKPPKKAQEKSPTKSSSKSGSSGTTGTKRAPAKKGTSSNRRASKDRG